MDNEKVEGMSNENHAESGFNDGLTTAPVNFSESEPKADFGGAVPVPENVIPINSVDNSNKPKTGVKKWIILGVILAVITIVVVVIVIVVVNNDQVKAPDDNEVNTDTNNSEFYNEETDNIIVEAEVSIYNRPQEEAFKYLDEQIKKYRGTKVEPRLLMLKAKVALDNNDTNKAFEIVSNIDFDLLDSPMKLAYYSLMQDIYTDNEEEYLKYYTAYWQLYDSLYDYVGDGDGE